jgi:C4-dicarboxylate transporter DctM subunit
VGLNLFVASHLAKMGMTEVSIACLPWLGVMLLYLVLVTYVPQVSLWLPHVLGVR